MIDRDKGSYDYMHPTLSSTKSANRLAYVCLTMGDRRGVLWHLLEASWLPSNLQCGLAGSVLRGSVSTKRMCVVRADAGFREPLKMQV